MIRVKISHRFRDHPFLRQTPGGRGEWGDYKFFVNDGSDECDYWVIYEGISIPERCRCPRDATILFTGEPPDIKRYPNGYIGQFAAVVTCQRDLPHPNLIVTQQALPWHAGMRMITRTGGPALQGYDDFARRDLPPKDRLISMFCSDKEATAGHRARRALAQRAAEHFGAQLDLYGKGSRFVEDKWDAIAPYRYHIVIENSQVEHYWTEKLADCYLAGAYPFYCGCPNLAGYFPVESFTAIDVHDPERAIERIEAAIEAHTYERAVESLKRARALVLDRYNLFPSIISIAERAGGAGSRAEELLIRPESHFREEEFAAANAAVAAKIDALLPAVEGIILVDEGCSAIPALLPHRRVVPFLEREGQYGGVPSDDATAVAELARLRSAGLHFIVFLVDQFWWLDHFTGLARHLCQNFSCIIENERLVIFDLRHEHAKGGR